MGATARIARPAIGRRVLLSSLIALLCNLRPAAAQSPGHPLDALTAPEYWTVFDVLKASGRTDTLTRYTGVNLKEPPKADVLAWAPGKPFRREAVAVLRQGSRTFEAVVDVANRRVAAWREITGVQPNVTEEEGKAIEDLVRSNPQWREAMRRRGITDYETIECGGGVFGYFDTPEERGRRLARAGCSDRRGAWSGQARPIEGVVVLIDLDKREVVRVIDAGVVPISGASADHDRQTIGPVREVPGPIFVQQPQGPGFTVDGHQVSWQNWRFHFRIDPRMGVVISTVRYQDGDRLRSVLYQGALTEIFVPYQDPSEGWYFVTFLDLGEASYGLATPLERGTDCPDHALFFDAASANERGIPQRRPNAACLFERVTGDMAWRHYSGGEGAVESRPRRDLVLRMIATAGNYDYLVDWVFMQDGTIKVVGAATGMVNVRTVASPTARAAGGTNGAELPDAYGHFVDRNTISVNHDHFLAFRLDLDVDGPDNSFVADRLVPRRLPEGHPRRSIWTVELAAAKREQDAQLDIDMKRPALWRVINPAALGPLGYPASYEIKPGRSEATLLSPDDNPQARGAFSAHELWVTRYAEGERFAAGDYVTRSRGGDGLPKWTAANRPIEKTDLVVWYTMGMHHVARAEDWPVMPVAWNEFELRPFDFFPRNPALDLPQRP